MVRPDTVLNGVKEAIKISDRLPRSTTYSIYEVDQDGNQANLKPPIVELTTTDVPRSSVHNTDLVDYATDEQGNEIGRIYNAKFEMPFQIDVWCAEGHTHDPYDLGSRVRRALYQYDDQQRGDPLPDPDDSSVPLDGVEKFMLNDGGVRNDLSMTPALRRWRQQGEVWFHETVNTAAEYGAEPYVATVLTPSASDAEVDGTASDATVDGVQIQFEAQ